MGKWRNFCFTLFGVGGAAPPPLVLDDVPSWVTFVVYQTEKCETTGRIHFQGYLECQGQQTFVRIKKEWPALLAAHFEPRRGSQAQAIEYCEKLDTQVSAPVRIGEPKSQGSRGDLLLIKEKIDLKRPLQEVCQDHFGTFARYSRFFKQYKREITIARSFKTFVVLFVGPSGTGKTRSATRLCHYLGSVYKLPQPKGSGTYWDDYDGHDCVFIDEMDGNYFTPTFFNTLCDRYECVVPVHGGAGHQFVSKYIIICSNYLPKFWWRKRNSNQRLQTLRRIDLTIPMFNRCPPAPKFFMLNGISTSIQYIHP